MLHILNEGEVHKYYTKYDILSIPCEKDLRFAC